MPRLFLLLLALNQAQVAFALSQGFWVSCARKIMGLSEKKAAPSQLSRSLIGEDLLDVDTLAHYAKNALALKPVGSGPVLSIVIPAYKEAQRIERSLVSLKVFLARYPIDVEVLVMAQHPLGEPNDGTFQIAESVVGNDARFRVQNLEQKGKGLAVREGVLQAKGDYVLFMDADLSTPLVEILHFLSHFYENPSSDLLIGSREQSVSYTDRSFVRNLVSKGNELLRKFLVGLPQISDTQCGFKAFKAEAAREIFSRQTNNGFLFDVEVLLLADRLHLQTDVAFINWIDEPVYSTVNARKEFAKMLHDLLLVRGAVNRAMNP